MPRVVLQGLGDGATRLHDAPAPSAPRNGLVIATQASVVSAGTERMLVDFGRASLLGKARSQPQRVAEVIDKARTDGLGTTIDAVRSKLAQPIPLGYSSAGVVIEVGRDVSGFEVGDRVAAAGPHAELAAVPANLTVPVPDEAAFAEACFATVGSIGLQGVRLAAPTIGERFVVTGLGLVGLLTVQVLLAQGCRVLGIDPNPERRKRAEAYGAATVASDHDVLGAADELSDGRGVDGVIVCASTSSSEPIHQAAQMCRQRGRIILVGVTGLELDRADFYEKELTFQVSASYGPGRYDPSYEDDGNDYPLGHVRWTAGRNMAAIVDLQASGRLDVASLITHEYAIDSATAAYETLVSDPAALGIVLTYPEPNLTVGGPLLRRRVAVTGLTSGPGAGRVGLIGAGNFAGQVLIPALKEAGATPEVIVSTGGTSASLAASRHGIPRASSDVADVLDDDHLDTVVIATRHNTHARYALAALRSGKNALVEKPLAIERAELDEIVDCVQELDAAGGVPLLGVGFNRRFAPITVRMADLLSGQRGPKSLILTMNAGAIPADHWVHDPASGGGRIVGEACHLIDLARFLVGEPIVDVHSSVMDRSGPADTASINLSFADGSIATVHYFANGSKKFAKERIEVFSGGRILVNDNFRTLTAHGWPGVRTLRLRRQDKGHAAAVAAFMDAVRSGGPAPIPLDELIEVSDISLRAAGIA